LDIVVFVDVGTKPLGLTEAHVAAPRHEKILHFWRKKLEQSKVSSIARPTLWPKVAVVK
jgi:hypothetical protein